MMMPQLSMMIMMNTSLFYCMHEEERERSNDDPHISCNKFHILPHHWLHKIHFFASLFIGKMIIQVEIMIEMRLQQQQLIDLLDQKLVISLLNCTHTHTNNNDWTHQDVHYYHVKRMYLLLQWIETTATCSWIQVCICKFQNLQHKCKCKCKRSTSQLMKSAHKLHVAGLIKLY